MKYIRIYKGSIQYGRDAGYPETKTRIYHSLSDVAKDNSLKSKGTLYELHVTSEDFAEEISKEVSRLNKEKKEKEKIKLENEIRLAKEKLEKLK